MSPKAADALTTKNGYCFCCLAVVVFSLISVFSSAQIQGFRASGFENNDVSLSRTSMVHPVAPAFHPILLIANFTPALQGAPYVSTMRVQGGLAPFRYSIFQGALPTGLVLNAATGTISGTPAKSGSFAFSVAVTDANFGYGHQSFLFTVGTSSQPQISVKLSPEAAQVAPGGKVQFSATVSNTSQTAVVWSASSGSITQNGLFTAPFSAGSVTVTATASANRAVTTSANISVQSAAPLTIATASLASAQVQSPYSAVITAQGGTEPYIWSINSGSLPAGISLNPQTGTIAGIPSKAGSFSFTAKVSDSAAHASTRQLTLSATAVNNGNFDGPAELPRVHVQSSMADTPAPGNSILVPAGANLQSIINSANCGDTIRLQAGATFTGSFTLPNKNCSNNEWIVIRTSAPDSALPPEGTRITPCYAGVSSLPARPALNCASTQKVMATLMAKNWGGPIFLGPGADHYRIGPGLEITRPVGTGINYALVEPVDANSAADHIIVDRDWLHGTPRDETNRGVHLSGVTYAAVVDSYLNDFHCTAGIGACTDSQAISGGSGNLTMGSWKISNNFLEAAAENILFGGATGSTIPTDIEITHNHFFKPLTWMQGNPGFVGEVNKQPAKCTQFHTPGFCPFIVKNLLEFKNAQRVLVEGNVLEYTWPGFTQHGTAVLFTALSQGGTKGNPNATVADITFRYNRVSHAAAGVVIAEAAYQWGPPKAEARLSIHDDIFDDISPAYYNGDTTGVGLAFQISQCPSCSPLQNISVNHVTMLMKTPRTFLILGAPRTKPVQGVT